MSDLPIPGLQDVARLIRPTVSETELLLRDYYEIPSTFSYAASRLVSKPLYSGDLSLQQVLDYIEKRVYAPWRGQNAEVAELIWQAAQGRSFLCHPLKRQHFNIRRDLAIPVKPEFYFVENGQLRIFALQPRRKYILSEEQLGVFASVIRRVFDRIGFEMADLELLDLSCLPGSKNRQLTIYRFSDLPLLSDAELLPHFERFAQAYDNLVSSGYSKPVRKAKRKPGPDSQLGLFD
jgi:hypothetical protein